jgi:hypothetical protein
LAFSLAAPVVPGASLLFRSFAKIAKAQAMEQSYLIGIAARWLEM